MSMADRVLSQQEIDNAFKKPSEASAADSVAKKAQPYDFRRPGRRIAQETSVFVEPLVEIRGARPHTRFDR